jgi:hypothetical protein
LERAAAENALPVGFFARVIWQESRFNTSAVSRKGAEGIAQFMPRTAEWRGLIDPFDSIAALKASASYLGDLRNRFGNLGLAAAAYNAGPQRVQDWLVGRASLPNETLSYIEIVTGHSASEWSGGTAQSNLALPEVVPCSQMARSFDPAAKSEKGQRNDHASSSPPPFVLPSPNRQSPRNACPSKLLFAMSRLTLRASLGRNRASRDPTFPRRDWAQHAQTPTGPSR